MFYIPNDCFTIRDEPFCLRAVCELQLASYSPKHTPQSLSDTPFCTYFKYITRKLWPPEVYQAYSTQIRSGRTGCRYDVYLGLSGSGGGNVQHVCFFYSCLHNHIPRCHVWKVCELHVHIWPVSYNPKYTLQTLHNTPFRIGFKYNLKLCSPEVYQTFMRQIKSGKSRK